MAGSMHQHNYHSSYRKAYGHQTTFHQEVVETLLPLIRRIKVYDRLRLQLENEGGSISDLNRITDILSTSIELRKYCQNNVMALSDPEAIRRYLAYAFFSQVHFQVRQLESRMPVYLLCRTRYDYWSAYGLVVEEYYCSPGYPVRDDRFVQLMDKGKETSYIDLAPFREGVKNLLSQSNRKSVAAVSRDEFNEDTHGVGDASVAISPDSSQSEPNGTRDQKQIVTGSLKRDTVAARRPDHYRACSDNYYGYYESGYQMDYAPGLYSANTFENSTSRSNDMVDQLLYDIGRHVFSAAWHEDQEVGMLTSKHFRLPRFGQAIELLYQCLSGDLCGLRSVVNDTILQFFADVYPQPALLSLLEKLPGLDGRSLNELSEEHARKQYKRLMGAFRKFLDVKVIWGNRSSQLPLYKLIFSNLSRLALVADDLREDPGVVEASGILEATAGRLIDEIIA